MTNTVLISINTSWNIVNFRAGLVRALRAKGYRVVAAAPRDAYSDRLAALVDEYIPLPMDNAGTSPWRDAWLCLRYWCILRCVRPSVMLTYTIKPNIYGSLAAAWCRVPVIANVSGLGTAFLRRPWLERLVQPLYRWAFRGARHVFFQNEEDRALFIQRALVAPEKTSLLPGSGVDLAYFNPVFNRPGDAACVRFVCIARLLRDKGIVEYVEAATAVKRRHPTAQFYLVGPTGVANQTAIREEELARWVAEGAVVYLGESDDIRSVMASQDCVVLPSYREGMSRVLLEAAAMGKPMIASDVPGCREIVEEGKNGFLCAPRDASSLADQMLRFLQLTPEQRAAFGRHSREKAEHRFDEQIIVSRYAAVMEQLASSTYRWY